MREILPTQSTGDEVMTAKIPKNLVGRIRVGNGTCPAGHSLMAEDRKFDGEPAIAVKVWLAGRSEMLYLNPFYGKFEYESDMPMKKGDVIEVFCPECNVSLTIDEQCNLCSIPMFAICLPDGGQVEACPTIGCHRHALRIVDMDEQIDRMYVGETKIQM